MTVSNTAERSRRIRTDESLTDLAACSFSLNATKAISVKSAAFFCKKTKQNKKRFSALKLKKKKTLKTF